MNERRSRTSEMGALSELAPELAVTLMSVASDVALVIDSAGVIESVALGGTDPVTATPDEWVGRAWADTVTADTRVKVEQLLRDVAAQGVSQRRQLNYPSGGGVDIPVSFTALRLGDRGRVLAVGRDLRSISAIQQRLVDAQQSMERDYWQTRQVETRYRLLFQISTDAVLVVDAETLRIVDANRAAGDLFGHAPDRLIGMASPAAVEAASRPALEAMFHRARFSGRAAEIAVKLAAGGESRLSATCFQSEGSMLLLVRARNGVAEPRADDRNTRLATFVERTPDAIVVTDASGRVLICNPAFHALVELDPGADARGRSLGGWIERSGSDLSAALAQVAERGFVRQFAARLRGERGRSIDVVCSAALVPSDEQNLVGFILRPCEPG